MSELDKMQKVISLVSTEIEKRRLQEAQEIIATAFRAMISGTGNAIKKEGKLVIPSLTEATEALRLFQQTGIQYGVVFPSVKTPQEIKRYLVLWGMEIVTKNR